MIELAWPWALAALLLPLLVLLLPRANDRGGAALRVPFYAELAQTPAGGAGINGSPRRWIGLLVWLLLVLAATRPQLIGEVEELPQTGRDLLLAVDVSGSMAAEDMRIGGRAVDRLTAVKVVLGDFLDRRVGDRVGLLLFGQQAYLMTPLTFDRNNVRQQLMGSAIGIAGRETAIGDAIGLAVKRLRDKPDGERVLILLTDGVNTAGMLDPLRAAAIARTEEVRVHTIGMGSDSGQRRVFGLSIATPGAEIDEQTLMEVAETTGGRYFRARDTSELAGIYAELDRLEPAAQPGEKLRLQDELYYWPLAIAGLIALLMLVSSGTLRSRRVSPERTA